MTTNPGYAAVTPVGTVAFGLNKRPMGSPQTLQNGVAYFPLGSVKPTRNKKYLAIFEGSTNFAKTSSPTPLT
jgi:hypothetical protein